MLNPEATALSHQALPLQLENLKRAYPYFRVIHVTDSSYDGKSATCAKMDYFNFIDCYALDLEGRLHRIQLKARETGNDDLVFICRKITDSDMIHNPHIGFTFGGKKYSFVLNGIDIFCELINGKIYNMRATDLMALEYDTEGEDNPYITAVRPQKYYDSMGQEFPSGFYYAFISVENAMQLKNDLLMAENRDYYYVYPDEQEQ